MLKTIAALLCIGSACGGLLAWTNAVTKPVVEYNRLQYTRALATDLLGETPDQLDLSQAVVGSCDTWLLRKVNTPGYAGEIEFLSLWSNKPIPTAALRTVKHQETPGIGDFIDQARDAWLTELDGATQAQLPSIDRVTGATVTYKAVLRALSDTFGLAAEQCQ
jgi:Na+-translocating ferredoxin:NAD+ oxidoreductase RnfG subunit